jgi:predicted small lipoprotein YifL
LKLLKKHKTSLAAVAAAFVLGACGQKVEVPPAHVGKIMTKDGYQESLIPTSKFRLGSAGHTVIDWSCWMYQTRPIRRA